MIFVTLAAKADPVQSDSARQFQGSSIRESAVGSKQPRPPQHVSCDERVDGHRPAPRDEDLPLHSAMANDVEVVGGIALMEDVLAGLEGDVGAAAGDEGKVAGLQALEERVLREKGLQPAYHISSPLSLAPPASLGALSSLARMARTSSVMSMATGHHVIPRPQPTQPEGPNWSIQVAGLWVIHCR